MKKDQQKAKEIVRKKDHYVNLMLITTVEAMVLFFGLIIIYKGYNSVPGIMQVRVALIYISILCFVAAGIMTYFIYVKKKDLVREEFNTHPFWSSYVYFRYVKEKDLVPHAIFSLFLSLILAFIRFGHFAFLYAIYIACIASAIYIIVAFVYFSIAHKRVK